MYSEAQEYADSQPLAHKEQDKWQSLERPSLHSRGLAAPDPFSTKERVQFNDLLNPQEEIEAGRMLVTQNGVAYAKKMLHGSVVEVEVRVGPKMVKVKSGYEYLSQGFRTAALEMREMLVDLNRLGKLLAKQEFEQTEYFAS